MIQGRVGKVVIGSAALVLAFAGGVIWNGDASEAEAPFEMLSNGVDESTTDLDAAADDADNALAAAEVSLENAERDFDRAMTDLDSPHTSRAHRPDPQMEMAGRHVTELNEMICKETGQNCEVARMARRQHQERYGSR